jgi:CHC2 zinc finger
MNMRRMIPSQTEKRPSPDSPARSKPLPQRKGYMSSVQQAEATRAPRYRGASYTRPIGAAKDAVPVIDLADRLCGPGNLRRVGKEWVGRCVLPDHEDRSPSFTVNPEKNVFFCHGCLQGGDVVELARLAWGYDQRDAHVAAAMLLMEFGHEVPRRPPAWFRKQERQRHTRTAIEETKKAIVRRRLFRHLILPLIDAIEDEEEHNRELDRAWSEFQRLAP